MDKKIVVGGTFDHLHKGHKELLSCAASLGSVKIGVTSNEMAKEMKGEEVEDYEARKEALLQYLPQAEVEKINDPVGFAVEEDFDYIVVSEETRKRAEEINEKRKSEGKEEMIIEEIDTVLAEDGSPLSSTRIRSGEIDKEGNLI